MPISDSELAHYHHAISLGESVRVLLGDNVGQHLLKKAQEEIDSIIDEFQYVDPTDTRVIVDLQVRLRSALAIPQWLEDALNDGNNAFIQYQERKEIEHQEEKGE